MNVKPLLSRFKSSNQEKKIANESIDNATSPNHSSQLLKLLSLSLQQDNGKNAMINIATMISYAMEVDAVCIIESIDNEAQIRYIFTENGSVQEIDQVWNDNDVFQKVIESSISRYYENAQQHFPNDKLLAHFDTNSFYCVPAINESNMVTAIICLLNKADRKYSEIEHEILCMMAQRLSRFFTREHEKNDTFLNNKTDHTDKNSQSWQLKSTQAELNAANQALESLSFAVSHDLRAPLRAIDGFSKILAEDYIKHLPDDAVNYVSRTRKACNKMRQMIDDLLWLSKVSRKSFELQDIDFSKLTENTINEIFDKKEISDFDLQVQPNLRVNADKDLLKIAIQQLASNSLKFCKNDTTLKISVFIEPDDSETVFAVRDNGIGFDMNYYDKLFEPFKHLHNNTDKFIGTGIGLAIVSRIISRHGGRIWADSEPEEGATFYFTLSPTNKEKVY